MEMPSVIEDDVLCTCTTGAVCHAAAERTNDQMRVNDAHKHLFSQTSRTLENISPTQAALM